MPDIMILLACLRQCHGERGQDRRLRAISRSFDSLAYEESQRNYQLVVGTPDQVIEKLRYVRACR